MFIYDSSDSTYKIAGTLYKVGVGGNTSASGQRVSSYIDEIAQNVSAMDAVTFEDKLLAGLEQDITVLYDIENDANELNPLDPNSDEVTITVTADGLSVFASNGANLLTLYINAPDDFDKYFFDPNSDLT